MATHLGEAEMTKERYMKRVEPEQIASATCCRVKERVGAMAGMRRGVGEVYRERGDR